MRVVGMAFVALIASLTPSIVAAWTPRELFQPCDGGCSVAIYWGTYVESSLSEILLDRETPGGWTYKNDHLVATAISRDTAQFFNGHLHLEPEIGIGQRYGAQDETEFWGALFFRYEGFPWDRWLVTTVAASTGLNYSTGVSQVEKDRARDGNGSQLMHFFAPEITFARPRHPDIELLVRFHHRSGVFGLVSDAWGGAQYATLGVRVRF